MANDTYPQLSFKAWTKLQKAFSNSLPQSISKHYLISMLGIKESSVHIYIKELKLLGLIDDQGNTTELAKKWRIESSYKEACDIMLDSIYPDELRHLAPDPLADRDLVKNWFKSANSLGESAAGKCTTVYLFLLNGDVSTLKEFNGQKKQSEKKKSNKQIVKKTVPDQKTKDIPSLKHPELNISIQIHISPDLSAEQIDNVFESMAKHLYSSKR